MEKEYSKNELAEKVMGKRLTMGIPFDQPCELGYVCPICKVEPYDIEHDIYDERLEWSEYNSFIYCSVCNKDYPSAFCQPDMTKAVKIFLESVHNAKINAPINPENDAK